MEKNILKCFHFQNVIYSDNKRTLSFSLTWLSNYGKKNMVDMCITKSPCCRAEINTTLYIDYTSLKKIFFKKETKHSSSKSSQCQQINGNWRQSHSINSQEKPMLASAPFFPCATSSLPFIGFILVQVYLQFTKEQRKKNASKADTAQNKSENSKWCGSRIFSLSQLLHSIDFEHIRHILTYKAVC